MNSTVYLQCVEEDVKNNYFILSVILFTHFYIMCSDMV